MAHVRWALAGMLTVASAGCGDDGSPSDATGSSGGDASSSTSADTSGADTSSTGDASSSTGADDDTSGSAGESSSSTGTPACDAFVPGASFEIAADVSNTRIHPHAAGDATGAWFSFVTPEPAGSLFDVMLMHLRCESDVDVAPLLVNTGPGNDIDASVAVSDDRVLVVWNTDDGTDSTSNLQINARTFDLDGLPLQREQFRVTTAFDGMPIVQNHTLAAVSAVDGGFSVAGLRAHPQSPAFVAFAQAVDASGTLQGEAFGAPVEEGISHMHASSASGWLTYARSGDDDQVWLAPTSGEAPFAVFGGGPATGGQVLAREDAPLAPLVAATIGTGSALDVGIALGDGDTLVLGDPGSLEHSPTVAQGPAGELAVIYHRNLGGLNNAVVFQRLAIDADAVVAVGDPEELDTQSPPYPPSLTWTPGGWLATWSRGQSPDFSTWGQVLAPR